LAQPLLFSPMKIGGLTVKNRIVMAPMLMGFGQFDGAVTAQMADYYEQRAKGGAGLIITEVTRVDDRTGAAAFAQMALTSDSQIAPLAAMAERIHAYGTKLFVQLHHPGRQNMGLLIGTVPLSIFMERHFRGYRKLLYKIVPAGKVLMEKKLVPRVVAPSKCEESYFSGAKSRALCKREIKKLVKRFAEAAERAKKAGADGVELHASHGYLIQQFLSPHTNKRRDEYGGPLENRMRFLLEIIAAVRAACGKDFPLIVRLTVDECYDRAGRPGTGYGLEEGLEMARRLERAGIDAIDVSCGGYDAFNYWLEPMSFEDGWRAYMAAAVKNEVSIPVIAANLIRSPEQAEKQLREGVQDFVSLGRPLIADPFWPQKAQEGKTREITRCINCLYCIESMQNNAYIGSHAGCSVNPRVGREAETLPADGQGRTVAVVGAGLAGLAAASFLCERGFQPVVFERNAQPGGQLIPGGKPPHKNKIAWCVEDLCTRALRAGAEFRFGTEADESLVAALAPYAVIVATGGEALRLPALPGAGFVTVLTAVEALIRPEAVRGREVVVVGSGMTGLETAESLAAPGRRVSVVEMAPQTAPGVWMQHVDDILPRLAEKGVKIYTSLKLESVKGNTLTLRRRNRPREFVEMPCDTLVLAVGVRSVKTLYDQLSGRVERLYLCGDAQKPGRIADAVASAYACVKAIPG